MNPVKSELINFRTVKELRALLSSRGPCLSVYLPIRSGSPAGSNARRKQNALRWKECLQTIEERATQFGSEGRDLWSSLAQWESIEPDSVEDGSAAEQSLVVFRSPEIFQVALLDSETPERAVIGPHFYIRPLLAELAKDRDFYLLALSQKNTRLLHCTTHVAEEVPFPSETKTDFHDWMNLAKPDHTAVDNAVSGARQGTSGPNALAPKGSDDEVRIEDLAHYFRQIDRGVNEVLHGKTQPLVLCGVEYELPIYREVSRHPHLAADDVRGAPNGLKAGEMHARALQALEADYGRKVDEALTEWNHRVGGGASSHLKDCVTAAHDGRVVKLLVSETLEQRGIFDEATHTVKGRETGGPADEDLVNDAAVQTVLHAGTVLTVPPGKMPNGSALAAIFRY